MHYCIEEWPPKRNLLIHRYTDRHLELPTSGLVEQHHNQSHWIAGLGESIEITVGRDCVPILSVSIYIGTSGLEAATLDLQLPVWSCISHFSSILLDPKTWGQPLEFRFCLP